MSEVISLRDDGQGRIIAYLAKALEEAKDGRLTSLAAVKIVDDKVHWDWTGKTNWGLGYGVSALHHDYYKQIVEG